MSREQQPKRARWLNRTVLGAGFTSALGDFRYETTTVILPGFLAVLGIPAALLGLIEGIADAVASFTIQRSRGLVMDGGVARRRFQLCRRGHGTGNLGAGPVATITSASRG